MSGSTAGRHLDSGGAWRSSAISRSRPNAYLLSARFTDTRDVLASTLDDAALTYVIGKDAKDADATVTLTRPVFEAAILGQRTLADALQRGELPVAGNPGPLSELMALFDDFDAGFAIVEPRRPQ